MTDEDAAEDPVADEEATEADEEATEADEEATEQDDGGLQEGDFVRLSLTARTVEGGQLVDTTDQAVAEEEGVDEEGATFEPRVVPLGEGHIFDAVQDDVVGREVGDTGEVVVPAAEAFGEYDPDQVRTVSVEKIPEDDRYPGAHVDVEGQHGHVETIVGGRARVDFNHPLAGEDVEYEYEILGVVDDEIGQAEGLFGMYFDGDFEMWTETEEIEREVPVEDDEEGEGDEDDEGDEESEGEPETETELVEETALYVEVPPQLAMNQQWLFQKNQVARDVMERLEFDRVVFQETVEGGMGMGMGMGMGGMAGMPGGGDVDEVVEELEEELPDEEGEAEAGGEAEAEPE